MVSAPAMPRALARAAASLPLGLAGMLALVLLVEGFIARHDLEFGTSWAMAWKASGRAARLKAPACGVLCFGDSLVKCGLLPRVIEQRLGQPAYNLAMPGCPAPVTYFLLRRALDAGARPSAIVVDFIPYLLAPESYYPENLRLDEATVDECLDLAWNTRSASFFALSMVKRVFPSVRTRYEARALIMAALEGKSGSPRDSLLLFLRNWAANDGAHVLSHSRVDDAELLSSIWENRRLLYPESWQCEPYKERYVRRFLALARAHRIPVYWLLPPMRSGVLQKREQSGVEADCLAFVRRLSAEFSNVTVVDGRRAGNYEGVFSDSMHVDVRGASALSADLAEIIRAGRSPRRHAPGRTATAWLELPAYHEQTSPAPVEDLNQSRMAILYREARLVR